MKYRLRPGVVSVNICGSTLLIPNREASEFCTGIRKISLPVLIALDKMEKNESMDIAYQVYSELMRRTKEEAREKIDGQLASLCESGFLLAVEDGE